MKRLVQFLVLAFLTMQMPQAFAQGVDFLGVKVAPDGNFGVGISEPTKKLHVNGDGLIAGTVSGVGHEGNYGEAALIKGFSLTGGEARFIFSYDDLHYPGEPRAIQITNADSGVFKTFVIDHPVDSSRYLVHATLEGPEGAVFYRGEGKLVEGQAQIKLPDYFEALTRKEGRTIQLTAIDGFDPMALKLKADGAIVEDGSFTVHSNNKGSNQRFFWELKAVRSDKPTLVAEPLRQEHLVQGFGPYKIIQTATE